MRYSKLFGKTVKDVPKDASLASHRLLYQAGYIRESVAGRYFFLPLGMKAQQKLMAIVKEEMDGAGAQEMLAPILHPLSLWQETNRDNEAGFELMQIADRRGMEFALGGTAEEMFVDVVRKFQLSYKDLPFNVYQFSTKFRDELRARGGLLRVREFIMKDAYSFHVDEGDFKKEYEQMWQTYQRIFERCGLEVDVVESDGGYIGGDYCHEFVMQSEFGGSRYLVSEDGSYAAHEDVAKFELEMVNPDEEVADLEVIDQPDWVRTMEENEKHYGKDARFFLKNVVYKNYEGDVVIATIRGDLDVNPLKLKHLLGETVDLEKATDDDLEAIGTKTGYVHSWGHKFVKPRKNRSGDRDCKVIYVADDSLKTVRNFIGGQKEEAKDTRNVNYGRDFKHEFEGDVAIAADGVHGLNGVGKLTERRGIEVGNIFQLGFHYSSKMKNADFIGNDGRGHQYYMGCYGIGIGRTLAAVVERHNDDGGIVWPKSLAPFQVHLVVLGKEEEIFEAADAVYEDLQGCGFEVLYDDRNESAGKKFADADLLGMPVRLVISKRTLENDEAEWKLRSGGEPERVKLKGLAAKLKEFYA